MRLPQPNTTIIYVCLHTGSDGCHNRTAAIIILYLCVNKLLKRKTRIVYQPGELFHIAVLHACVCVCLKCWLISWIVYVACRMYCLVSITDKSSTTTMAKCQIERLQALPTSTSLKLCALIPIQQLKLNVNRKQWNFEKDNPASNRCFGI